MSDTETMNFQKVQWKLFFKPWAQGQDTESLFGFFNTLIENSPQIFVDIADYKHVPRGPVVLLVGVQADVGFDAQGGEIGLVYSQKKYLEESNQSKLRNSLRDLLDIYYKMVEYKGFTEPPMPDLSKMSFLINDRAIARNTAEDYNRVQRELQMFCEKTLGQTQLSMEKTGSENDRLTVMIRSEAPFDFDDLRKRLSADSGD